jgi:putrescine aminotransferase
MGGGREATDDRGLGVAAHIGEEGKAGPIVRDACIKNGLMVRGIRDSIVMCPPLIISHAEIDRMIDIIARSLREAEPVLRALKA